jgi:hypothetical protein
MRTPKPKTWAEYKQAHDKPERPAESEARNPFPGNFDTSITSMLSGLRFNPKPQSPGELRDQFFELRYAGVPRKTIEKALDIAYADDDA